MPTLIQNANSDSHANAAGSAEHADQAKYPSRQDAELARAALGNLLFISPPRWFMTGKYRNDLLMRTDPF
ncbi:hypothetical protein [Arthrobacter sp. PsM3]|uniref:hypothetical protein n=1 Tax=Arthrobacter sp. PsM3 TaxID=3030531 RepID=UPI00263B2EF4|nr:hypothetical protein [Arthrobacter sp. PsM3]MDN4642642.1 hypothetical protein [Arthrobacter sp. PsM3]